MEEEPSMISNATTVFAEASDSNSSDHQSNHKLPRKDNNVTGSKFKGVSRQQNGGWGAQIYANHQRIWLGTFKSEKEAAMAYDSAAIKVRSGDSTRNFPWTDITVHEQPFQSQYSLQAILNMIRDGSYPSMFNEYLRVQFQKEGETGVRSNLVLLQANGSFHCRELFQKELTPSDVSKLNRLVIPKKQALKYFPRISDREENVFGDGENVSGDKVGNVQLHFYDRSMRLWRFRYCYWSSSQSFVFTRGWSKFVKEKKLQEKDVIIFSAYESIGTSNKVDTICIIDVVYCERKEENAEGIQDIVEHEDEDDDVSEGVALGLDIRLNIVKRQNEKKPEGERKKMRNDSTDAEKKGFRLFGVQIV